MAGKPTCGEALVGLLEAYGVDTIFGIPGVHTLEMYRGLARSNRIRHIQPRHEQGAGFMADGYARASGRPGVCMVITGPGVTNGLTALGQAFADSVPVLMISSDTARRTRGKGWGCLHEIPNQQAVTAQLTALSAAALFPGDVPEFIGQAFSLFAAERPRPAHLSIPIDVLAMETDGEWVTSAPPARPSLAPETIAAAADLLAAARRPMIYAGGGAAGAAGTLANIAERLDAPVIASNAGKGVVPDLHPLSLGGSVVAAASQAFLGTADVLLAIGTELSETDSFVDRLDIRGKLIRIDIDPRKMNDLYPADVGIVADAGPAAAALDAALAERTPHRFGGARNAVAAVRRKVMDGLTPTERQHVKVLNALRRALPSDAVVMGDISQVVYTGTIAFPVDAPRLWHYPAGYCTLGCALPCAIGAKVALPDRPVAAIAGDGGFMLTVQELATAAELRLPLPVVIWNNDGLGQIRDDMVARKIRPVGVDSLNPDFVTLAKAFHCRGVRPKSVEQLEHAVVEALAADRPTLIEVHQDADWLL